MTKDQVQVGEAYEAKVGSRWVGVTILGPAKTGWNAVSDMGKPVRVKDVRHLRPAAAEPEAPQRAPEAQREAIAPVGDPEPAEVAPRAKRPAKAKATAAVATPAKEAKKPEETTAKPAGKLTCLDAAAQVLQQADEPLQCKTMVARMQEQGLWTTAAPTPAATLYSAILREITVKGDSSRFKKTDRGHFALNGGN
ncbi:MAG TPA: HTH domain-containing protein [Tepidisphaeraceae bacterium]|jgi:hypothetical protein|nr:HTH domain-containing protein [Tepidisphaeraceae bacterium]